MSLEKEEIKILIPTISTGRRWIEEVERANEENPEYISCEVRHPYDFQLYIPEDETAAKLMDRKSSGEKFRIIQDESEKPGLQYDAVIPRISGSRTFEYGANVIRHLTIMGTYTTAPGHSLETCANKWKTSQLLALHGIPVPDQLLLNSVENFQRTIDLVKGIPAIGKLSRGSEGNGVFILESHLAAKTALQTISTLKAEISLSRFVKTSDEENTVEDIRAWVLNGTGKNPTIYAMKRITTGDFRANISLNGTGYKVELTLEEKNICIECAKIFNMDLVAVDIIRDITHSSKPLILELNGNPGLKIEKFIGENIVGKVVDMVIKKVRERRKTNKTEKFWDYAHTSSFASGSRNDINRLLTAMNNDFATPKSFSTPEKIYRAQRYLTALQHHFSNQLKIHSKNKKYGIN